VVEFLDGLERCQGLRHQVNRCLETLRLIFAFAIERELISVNPAVGVSKRKVEIPRDRALSSDELATLWRAIDDLPELPKAYFRMLLLTGSRRDEVRSMAWSEVDLDAALWRLPAERNKSARPFEIPLSAPAVEAIRALPQLGPLVFTLNGHRAMTVRGCFDRLRQSTGLIDIRLHDLRRTVRTGLAKIGIPFEIAERVLNHAMPGLQAVYNVHTYSAEKRRALQLWAEHVLAIAEEREAKVVVFQSTAA
jgi:integrase